MIECAQCGKQNTIDGRFCRSCGIEFPEALLAAGRESLESTLRDAHDLLGRGRFQEATLLAESAHESDPSSASALSLLGECHERAGRYDLALEYFERASALNPDSNLDKLKVQRLRKVIASQDLVEPASTGSNRNALFAAIAAVVLVVSLGAAFAIGANTGGGAAKAQTPSGPVADIANNDSRPFATGGPEMALKSDTKAVDVPEVKDGEGETVVPEEGAEPPVGEDPAKKTESTPRTERTTEPKPATPKTAPVETETRPLAGAPKIELSVSSGPKTEAPPTDSKTQDKDKDKEKDKPKSDPPKKEQKSDPGSGGGIIDIRPSTGKAGSGGGSSTSGENSVKVRDEGPKTLRHWLEVARSRMMLRDWEGAANAYENAMRAGADPGITNQRLGQCYQELGRKADARAAYQRAIKAFESQRKVAPERTERLNISIDACKQALRVLGG